MVARERVLFEARLAALLGQIEAAGAQRADTNAEVRAQERNLVTLVEGARLMREERATNEALLHQGFVSMVRVLSPRRNVEDYESRRQTVQAEWARARQRKAELEGRVANLKQAYVQSAADDLRDTGAREADQQPRRRAASDATKRQEITASVGRSRVDLRVNGVGFALGAREPIVDIVPAELSLLVEAHLAADVVAGILPGQPVEIHLGGRVHRRRGRLEGRVANVSPDALRDPYVGAPYFTALVAPDVAALDALGRDAVTPGLGPRSSSRPRSAARCSSCCSR